MRDYFRTSVSNCITVDTIITVHYTDLRRKIEEGEAHDFPELYYVDEGVVFLLIDGAPVTLRKGQMLVLKPNSFHDYQPGSQPIPAKVGIISFAGEYSLLESLYNRPMTLNAGQRERYADIIKNGALLFERVYNDRKRRGFRLREDASAEELQMMKNLLEFFLLELYQAIGRREPKQLGSNQEKFDEKQMLALNRYLQARLNENMSLDQMASALGVSVSKLRRMVSEREGCGPLAYFMSLKIKEAKRLIRTSSLNVGQIAEYLGFNSIHYFSRQFKLKVGKSPTEYAKSIQE